MINSYVLRGKLYRSFLFLSALFIFLGTQAAITSKGIPIGIQRFDKVRVNNKNYEKVKNLHVNWYSAAIKALLGQLGKDLYSKLGKNEKKALAACLDRIDDKRDLVESARCLVKTRKAYFLLKREEIVDEIINAQRRKERGWIGGFRTRRSAPGQKRMQNDPATNNLRLAHKLISDQSVRRNEFQLNKISQNTEKWTVKHASKMSVLRSSVEKSPVARVANIISSFTSFQPTNHNNQSSHETSSNSRVKWTNMYNKLLHLKQQDDAKKNSPGARVYDLRMFDLVLGNERPTMSATKKKTPEGLMQTGLQIFNILAANKNDTQRQESNIKMLSPRFAPLMPDKSESTKAHLSPTILAFYDDEDIPTNNTKRDADQNIASVPQVLKASGMNKHDRQTILELLMDVSGTTGHVEDALTLLTNLNFLGIEGEIFSANNRISSAYERLEQSFEPLQAKQLDTNGFSFLEKHQINNLFTDQNTHLPQQANRRLNDFAKTSVGKREDVLWRRVERIAKNIPDDVADKLDRRRWDRVNRHRRRKRQLPFSLLKPVVLAPFMFTPSIGPVVLGPVVLSPSIFSPLILNPAVLSPYVLSPSIPIPFIISPYLLSPYVISPLAMAPFILNPYVLSPNVINPYLLSPLILSPLVLCPDVISPMAFGGAILSPSVGSPAILTENFIMANVLSPSFLS